MLAGTNMYDVMYHQHYMGSYKLIPLPAVGEYIHLRIKKGILFDPVLFFNNYISKLCFTSHIILHILPAEMQNNKCKHSQWNPESNLIIVGGTRLSKGKWTIIMYS